MHAISPNYITHRLDGSAIRHGVLIHKYDFEDDTSYTVVNPCTSSLRPRDYDNSIPSYMYVDHKSSEKEIFVKKDCGVLVDTNDLNMYFNFSQYKSTPPLSNLHQVLDNRDARAEEWALYSTTSRNFVNMRQFNNTFNIIEVEDD